MLDLVSVIDASLALDLADAEGRAAALLDEAQCNLGAAILTAEGVRVSALAHCARAAIQAQRNNPELRNVATEIVTHWYMRRILLAAQTIAPRGGR